MGAPALIKEHWNLSKTRGGDFRSVGAHTVGGTLASDGTKSEKNHNCEKVSAIPHSNTLKATEPPSVLCIQVVFLRKISINRSHCDTFLPGLLITSNPANFRRCTANLANLSGFRHAVPSRDSDVQTK
jgi:hypothetical protein